MSRLSLSPFRPPIASTILIAVVLLIGTGLALWKYSSIQEANAATARQPEPMESVAAATARAQEYRQTTTSIGTVLALQSVTLRNEVAGTVRQVTLTPGETVEAGTVLVGLDVSVEQAELKAQEAQATLAGTELARVQRLMDQHAAPQAELDRATAQRDVARAQIARFQAVIDRKTIRAPFRARVGLADVHPGQYLSEGTLLTTLQGVESGANVDFEVAQQVAAGLHQGDPIQVVSHPDAPAVTARIVAVDARIDPATRNATVRARTIGSRAAPTPGSSVRVLVPVGPARQVVTIPVSALRKGPGGDHVFVIAPDQTGKTRVHLRPVQSGPVLGDDVVIIAGLAPGEQLAASGSFKLRESALVAIAPDSAASANPSR
jgi:membrane fusion protein (multidrug efflux system)